VAPDLQHTSDIVRSKLGYPQAPSAQSIFDEQTSSGPSLELIHLPPTHATLEQISLALPQKVPSGWSVQKFRQPLEGQPSWVYEKNLAVAPDAQHTLVKAGFMLA